MDWWQDRLSIVCLWRDVGRIDGEDLCRGDQRLKDMGGMIFCRTLWPAETCFSMLRQMSFASLFGFVRGF